MKKVYLLLLSILFAFSSCDKDEQNMEENVVNKLTIIVDGKNYTSINNNVGGNENCDKVFISTSYYKKNDIDFRLNFDISKSGKLLKVSYQEYDLTIQTSQVAKLFLTKNFNPTATFSIQNFEYNNANNTVKFNFQGTVFLENQNNITRTVSGSVEINDFKTFPCNAEMNSIEYYSNEFQFNSFSPDRTRFFNQTQEHRFFSNSGFLIKFFVADDFWNLPAGEYPFDQNTNSNKVFLQQYISTLIANQTPIYNVIDWKNYQTRGSFTIETKIIENGFKTIKGKITMEVLFENIVVYSINNMNFSIGSFVN